MDTKEKLGNILVDKLGLDIDSQKISDNQSIQGMGMDSLLLVKLIYTLEDDYGVSLKTEEILEVNTYGDLLSLLEEKFGAESLR